MRALADGRSQTPYLFMYYVYSCATSACDAGGGAASSVSYTSLRSPNCFPSMGLDFEAKSSAHLKHQSPVYEVCIVRRKTGLVSTSGDRRIPHKRPTVSAPYISKAFTRDVTKHYRIVHLDKPDEKSNQALTRVRIMKACCKRTSADR